LCRIAVPGQTSGGRENSDVIRPVQNAHALDRPVDVGSGWLAGSASKDRDGKRGTKANQTTTILSHAMQHHHPK
jgi:hypothetical protein